MRPKVRQFANLRVGKPDVTPSKPSHVLGVRQGNKPRRPEHQPGFHFDQKDQRFAKGSAERSTGIKPDARNPILPGMPNLSPS